MYFFVVALLCSAELMQVSATRNAEVGTHHKAGSQLLRNTMKWAFDHLGANYSCHENSYMTSTITSNGGDYYCSDSPDCRIHWNNARPESQGVCISPCFRNQDQAGPQNTFNASAARGCDDCSAKALTAEGNRFL